MEYHLKSADSSFTKIIPQLIEESLKNVEKKFDDTFILDHLGKYDEEPYHIIESYFRDQYLDTLSQTMG